MMTWKSSRRVWARARRGLGVVLCLAALGCTSRDADDGSARRVATPPREQNPPAMQWKRPRFAARQAERDAMARQIKRYGLTDETVLAAMLAVPRHEFVPPDLSTAAYADGPLPIGRGQTISQPFIVAEMTRQLKLTRGSRVLEIGTGSGYQAAVLSEFTPHVYTIEIVKSLADTAALRLRRLGYETIQVRHGDGYMGWKEHAPFDAIIVTCGAPSVPLPLLEQLAPAGRIVIPVGDEITIQQLMVVEKALDGATHTQNLMPVRFVPLTREVR